MVRDIVMVAVGGAAGSVLRYLVSGWIAALAGRAFPWGTLVVNVIGCLAIGLLAGSIPAERLSPLARLMLVTGFCGGFTTFSTFALENMSMLQSGRMLQTALYVGGSVVAGIMAAWAGMRIAS